MDEKIDRESEKTHEQRHIRIRIYSANSVVKRVHAVARHGDGKQTGAKP